MNVLLKKDGEVRTDIPRIMAEEDEGLVVIHNARRDGQSSRSSSPGSPYSPGGSSGSPGSSSTTVSVVNHSKVNGPVVVSF